MAAKNKRRMLPHAQADALDLAVIDTSLLSVTEASQQLEGIVRRLIEPHAPEKTEKHE